MATVRSPSASASSERLTAWTGRVTERIVIRAITRTTARPTTATTRLTCCERAMASSSRTWARALSAARASFASPTAPSDRSLAAWISSQRARMPTGSATARLIHPEIAVV